MNEWPKKPTTWIEERALYVSIPFTWNIPVIASRLKNKNMFWDQAIVGGPAVRLMPDIFNLMPWVFVVDHMPGVMQKVNPQATKTSTGCIRSCKFCAVPKTEGRIKELSEWPDLPIICDNNLLACSISHFDKVIDRAKKHEGVDFNQGLDARLLTYYHAQRLAELKKPVIRLALDSMKHRETWEAARFNLLSAGMAKSHIRSYALIGFDSSPQEAWERCDFIDKKVNKVLPMWFHELDADRENIVTPKQVALGWDDNERRKIMGFYYKHRGENQALGFELGGVG